MIKSSLKDAPGNLENTHQIVTKTNQLKSYLTGQLNCAELESAKLFFKKAPVVAIERGQEIFLVM